MFFSRIEHVAHSTDSNQHPCMLIDGIRIVGVRGLVIFVLWFGNDGPFTTADFGRFLKTTPAHGSFTNQGIIKISSNTFFGFLTPGTRFRGMILREIHVHCSDLSRIGVIRNGIKRVSTVQERSDRLENLFHFSQWISIGSAFTELSQYRLASLPKRKEWNGRSGSPVSTVIYFSSFWPLDSVWRINSQACLVSKLTMGRSSRPKLLVDFHSSSCR